MTKTTQKNEYDTKKYEYNTKPTDVINWMRVPETYRYYLDPKNKLVAECVAGDLWLGMYNRAISKGKCKVWIQCKYHTPLTNHLYECREKDFGAVHRFPCMVPCYALNDPDVMDINDQSPIRCTDAKAKEFADTFKEFIGKNTAADLEVWSHVIHKILTAYMVENASKCLLCGSKPVLKEEPFYKDGEEIDGWTFRCPNHPCTAKIDGCLSGWTTITKEEAIIAYEVNMNTVATRFADHLAKKETLLHKIQNGFIGLPK